MRIKVFSLTDERDGKPALVDIDARLRIRVWHGGALLEIAEDVNGHLVLREVDGRSLNIHPRASNEVRVTAEPWS